MIVNSVQQRDFLLVLAKVYDDSSTQFNIRCGQTESFKNFDICVSAQVAKFISFCTTSKLWQSSTKLMLLNSSGIEHSQIVFARSAAALAGTEFSDQPSNDDFIATVTYKKVSCIVMQHEKANYRTLTASAGCPAGNLVKSVIRYTQAVSRDLKFLPCHTCNKFATARRVTDTMEAWYMTFCHFDTSGEYSKSLKNSSPS